MSHPDLSIGEIAEACHITVSAVRYYDEVGLIAASRRVGGKRRFAEGAISRVVFIRRCQEAGFTLDEIGDILHANAGEWRESVDAKLSELQDRRRRLDETIDMLTELRTCGCRSVDRCDALHRC